MANNSDSEFPKLYYMIADILIFALITLQVSSQILPGLGLGQPGAQVTPPAQNQAVIDEQLQRQLDNIFNTGQIITAAATTTIPLSAVETQVPSTEQIPKNTEKMSSKVPTMTLNAPISPSSIAQSSHNETKTTKPKSAKEAIHTTTGVPVVMDSIGGRPKIGPVHDPGQNRSQPLEITDSSGTRSTNNTISSAKSNPSNGISTGNTKPKEKEEDLPELMISGSSSPVVLTKEDKAPPKDGQKPGEIVATHDADLTPFQNSGGTSPADSVVKTPDKLPPLQASGVDVPQMQPEPPATPVQGTSEKGSTEATTNTGDNDEPPPITLSDGIPKEEMPQMIATSKFPNVTVKKEEDKIPFCWKQHYPRGAGTIPNQCDGGKIRQGLLCHNTCKEGYVGVGFLCWEKCPDGYRNGIRCVRHKPFHLKKRKRYRRGIGTHMVCPPDRENRSGLCYKKCKPKYKGIATVCWGTCPADQPFNCGASCAKDWMSCGGAVFKMAFSTAELIANLILVAITAGEWIAIKPAITAAATSAKFTAAELRAAKFQVQKHLFNKMIGGTLGIKERMMYRGIDEMVGSAISGKPFEWGKLDPTGIRAVVKSFKKPVCEYKKDEL